jgi:hypothetical protein
MLRMNQRLTPALGFEPLQVVMDATAPSRSGGDRVVPSGEAVSSGR